MFLLDLLATATMSTEIELLHEKIKLSHFIAMHHPIFSLKKQGKNKKPDVHLETLKMRNRRMQRYI